MVEDLMEVVEMVVEVEINMKKLLLSIIVLFILTNNVNAQTNEDNFRAWFYNFWDSAVKQPVRPNEYLKFSVVFNMSGKEEILLYRTWTTNDSWRIDEYSDYRNHFTAKTPEYGWSISDHGLVYIIPNDISDINIPKIYEVSDKFDLGRLYQWIWYTGGLSKIKLFLYSPPDIQFNNNTWIVKSFQQQTHQPLEVRGIWDIEHKVGYVTYVRNDITTIQSDNFEYINGEYICNIIDVKTPNTTTKFILQEHSIVKDLTPFKTPNIGGQLDDGTQYYVEQFADFTSKPYLAMKRDMKGILVQTKSPADVREQKQLFAKNIHEKVFLLKIILCICIVVTIILVFFFFKKG